MERRPSAIGGHVIQLGNEQPQIVVVATMRASPASRVDPRHAVERVHGKAGVIANCGQARELAHLAGLQQGIGRERGPGLLHVWKLGELIGPCQVDIQAQLHQDAAHLDDLVPIPACEHDSN